jgi:AcrR family transcriptional regulator
VKRAKSQRGNDEQLSAARPATVRRSARRVTEPAAPLRRRDILHRAAELMQKKGYGGISAQHIADALEFSKANFFYHVKSKEDLLYHIFVDTLQFTVRHVEEIISRDATSTVKLRALIDLYVQLMTDHAAVMQVWFKEKDHLTPEHEAAVTRLEEGIQTSLNDFYAEAMRRGEFRAFDPRVARAAVFGMCYAFTRLPKFTAQLGVAKLTEQLQQFACGALLSDQPQSGAPLAPIQRDRKRTGGH